MSELQSNFWKSDFAKDYIKRNNIDDKISNITSRMRFFFKVLEKTKNIKSICEFGANIGMNIIALKNISELIDITAIEISEEPFEILKGIEGIKAINSSILDLNNVKLSKSDMTFTSGVLIHIAPKDLKQAYKNLYEFSNRYILVSEYYNPTPSMIPYHGVNDVLFKRDFAGDLLDTYPDLVLVDYGFIYRRDPNFPLGDMTWFLLEKAN